MPLAASALVDCSVTEPFRLAAGAVIVAVGAMLSRRRLAMTAEGVPGLPATSAATVRTS